MGRGNSGLSMEGRVRPRTQVSSPRWESGQPLNVSRDTWVHFHRHQPRPFTPDRSWGQGNVDRISRCVGVTLLGEAPGAVPTLQEVGDPGGSEGQGPEPQFQFRVGACLTGFSVAFVSQPLCASHAVRKLQVQILVFLLLCLCELGPAPHQSEHSFSFVRRYPESLPFRLGDICGLSVMMRAMWGGKLMF